MVFCDNLPDGHDPQHASYGIGGGLLPQFLGSLQPKHSVKHSGVVSKKYIKINPRKN